MKKIILAMFILLSTTLTASDNLVCINTLVKDNQLTQVKVCVIADTNIDIHQVTKKAIKETLFEAVSHINDQRISIASTKGQKYILNQVNVINSLYSIHEITTY